MTGREALGPMALRVADELLRIESGWQDLGRSPDAAVEALFELSSLADWYRECLAARAPWKSCSTT